MEGAYHVTIRESAVGVVLDIVGGKKSHGIIIGGMEDHIISNAKQTLEEFPPDERDPVWQEAMNLLRGY